MQPTERQARRVLIPDLVLTASGATSGVGVTVQDGQIAAVEPATDGERLPRRALAPGFVNAHSHAFQRAFRGKVERLDPAHPHDDFWTWRTAMYTLADQLDPDSIFAISRRCFDEMLRAGYTSVAEFHYVHHQPDGTHYADPNELAKAVVAAAEDAGIRLLLLPAAYARGGLPRFRDPDVNMFLKRVDDLRSWVVAKPLVEIGVAAHSVRAVPRSWIEQIAQYAIKLDLPLHIHADEQPREIEECLAEHDMRPIELLHDAGFLSARTTIIHATHADEHELDLLGAAGATICACPTTEGNLGDGFLPAEKILKRGINLTIGSDSQVRIDPWEELREIETNARRLAGRRNVLIAPGDTSPATWLLRSGWQTAALAPGIPADMIEIDLDHPTLAEIAPDDLSAALVFGASSDVIVGAWVGGARRGARHGDTRDERVEGDA